MEMYPRDLGSERYLSILRRRLTPFALPQNGQALSTPALDEATDTSKHPLRRRIPNRGRRLRRYWLKDLQLDDDTAEKLGNALWRGTPGMNVRVGVLILSVYLLVPMLLTAAFNAPMFVPFLLLLLWAISTAGILTGPRQAIKKLHEKPLSASEMETLLPTARGRPGTFLPRPRAGRASQRDSFGECPKRHSRRAERPR